jgi:hypothetical protein
MKSFKIVAGTKGVFHNVERNRYGPYTAMADCLFSEDEYQGVDEIGVRHRFVRGVIEYFVPLCAVQVLNG